jgi:predicted Zn-dependent protease
VDEAQRLAERAHLKQPGNADYSDTLAWIYLKQSQTQAALQILRNVVQKYPSNPVFRYHLGAALLKKGDRQKAREELQATLAMKPSQQEEREVRTLLGQLN